MLVAHGHRSMPHPDFFAHPRDRTPKSLSDCDLSSRPKADSDLVSGPFRASRGAFGRRRLSRRPFVDRGGP
jgi:hypothetical protein